MQNEQYQNSDVIELDRLLTVEEVAAWLRLKPRTVVELAWRGRLPATKVGKRWRFRVSAINAYLEQGERHE